MQRASHGAGEAAGTAAPSGAARDNPSRRPLLVRTATLTVQSSPVQESLDRITAIAEELGGYLARRTDDQVEVRVPADRFDVAIDAVMAAVDEVVLWDARAEDVYEDRRNLTLRLDNLRAFESRLLRTREAARTAYGALLVERDLLEITQAIEQAQGRLQDLDERIAYATLVVTHAPVSRAAP